MFGILTILVVTLAVIITVQNTIKNSEKKTDTSLVVPSPTSSQAPSPTFTPTPSLKAHSIPSEGNQPTSIPTTLTPTSKPNQASEVISDFQYPGSTVVSITNNTATFESADDSKMITDWYKDKIKNMGMVATSFVQTSANGNVFDKLVGADGATEVRVEITKQNNSQTVNIYISLSL